MTENLSTKDEEHKRKKVKKRFQKNISTIFMENFSELGKNRYW